MELINATGLAGRFLLGPDRDGYEVLTAILKGTFDIRGDACVRAEEQAELVGGDTFHGEPDASSVKLHSDLAPFKPATDVVLTGNAYAPRVGATESTVRFRVGSVGLDAVISGDRFWSISLGIAKTHGPKPFETIPLTYEHAFGGVQPKEDSEEIEGAEERNPVGRGFVKKRNNFVNGLKLPNIEDPGNRLKRPGQTPAPAGFGFVARHWLPRRNYNGTYDAAWERDRMPLLPEDFDERAFNGAPETLQATPHLRGDERVLAEGVRPNGPLAFALPGLTPQFALRMNGAWDPLQALLDTVVVDAEAQQVQLTWRARRSIHGKVRQVRAVRMVMP